MPVNSEVAEWVEKAEEDYDGTLALMRQRVRPLPNLVCFHAQQCAEKYLKAALVNYKTPFPNTHDLIDLHDLLEPSVANLKEIFDSLSVLSPYGVGVRYPGTASTHQQAKDAVEAMKETRKFFRKHLELDD
jgi:HEPN domain-containing protein